MRVRWVAISVLAVGVGIGAGALSWRRRSSTPPPSATGAAVIHDAGVTLSGMIRPQHITPVTAAVDGNVDAFLANVGDEVFAGQVLARIGATGLESDREAAARAVEYGEQRVSKAEAAVVSSRQEASRADADLQRTRSLLDRASQTYARQRTLNAAGATPRLTYEKAEQDYQAAQQEFEIMDKAARAAAENVRAAMADLAAAKELLASKSREAENAQSAVESAEVRAPVDGLVVERKGEVGKPVPEAGGALFQIATDIYALEVALDPEPGVLQRMRPGDPALVMILDLQTGGLPGTVKEIKGTQAIVEFTSTMPAIRPGMRADVRLRP